MTVQLARQARLGTRRSGFGQHQFRVTEIPQDPLELLPVLADIVPRCRSPESLFPAVVEGQLLQDLREFPLDIKAAAGSMLARCIAKDDAGKYFAVIDMLFRQQNEWVLKNTTETLTRIGKQAGLSQQQVEDCLKDQALLDKIAADQKYANEVLKVNSTPSFFINGEMLKGDQSFEEFDKRIKSLLKS